MRIQGFERTLWIILLLCSIAVLTKISDTSYIRELFVASDYQWAMNTKILPERADPQTVVPQLEARKELEIRIEGKGDETSR